MYYLSTDYNEIYLVWPCVKYRPSEVFKIIFWCWNKHVILFQNAHGKWTYSCMCVYINDYLFIVGSLINSKAVKYDDILMCSWQRQGLSSGHSGSAEGGCWGYAGEQFPKWICWLCPTWVSTILSLLPCTRGRMAGKQTTPSLLAVICCLSIPQCISCLFLPNMGNPWIAYT